MMRSEAKLRSCPVVARGQSIIRIETRMAGTDPGFLKGGWLIPIGHQTIRSLGLNCPGPGCSKGG